ncbi:hypothetical protein AAMO2058_000646900 [Amorphochlora amoebiformis]
MAVQLWAFALSGSSIALCISALEGWGAQSTHRWSNHRFSSRGSSRWSNRLPGRLPCLLPQTGRSKFCQNGLRGGVGLRVQGGWSSPHWNWGYAQGEAHDRALVLRRRLSTPLSREKWLTASQEKGSDVDFEEVKLCLALAWQRAARELRDKGGADVLEDMRLAKFEGENGMHKLCEALESLSPSPDTCHVESMDTETRTRLAAGRILMELKFIRVGL